MAHDEKTFTRKLKCQLWGRDVVDRELQEEATRSPVFSVLFQFA